MGKSFAIRVDASVAIGSGHLMRCLTLAARLRRGGGTAFFVCRDLPGNLVELVEREGYRVHRLPAPTRQQGEGSDHGKISCPGAGPTRVPSPEGGGTGRGSPRLTPSLSTNPRRRQAEEPRDVGKSIYLNWLGVDPALDAAETAALLEQEGGVDWLIVDHYALDARWEQQVRHAARRIMVIDDLANRPHDCDLLLDQNLYRDPEGRYRGLVPKGCRVFLGPRHALLREEFLEARRTLGRRHGTVRRILIFMGGADPGNETGKALEAFRFLDRPEIESDVVVGAANPHCEEIREICAVLPHAHFHCQVGNIAELAARADLAIGAGGTATWERCYLGLPALTLVLADNQAEGTEAVAAAGAAWNLGRAEEVGPNGLLRALRKALGDPAGLRRMGEAARELMGEGGTGIEEELLAG